jgi:hypothetical protein
VRLEPTCMNPTIELWPELPLDGWQDTYDTLHMWTQIVGKIRMTLTPLINHYWNVTLYVSARGLTTSAIPYPRGLFEMEFDFVGHQLVIETSVGEVRRLELAPRTVADFYADVMGTLAGLHIDAKIHAHPDEVANPIPFAEDRTHKSYDRESVERFYRLLISVEKVLKNFRSRFIGKCSPVHFFWGSFDLAVTRFSGRPAPPRSDPQYREMMQEAYSHEVSSAGFWPGGGEIKGPAFYSYTTPEPTGFKTYPILPKPAFYHPGLGEFLLMYDDIRSASLQSGGPESDLMDFLQSTYEAGANSGHWDRAALERPAGSRANTGG